MKFFLALLTVTFATVSFGQISKEEREVVKEGTLLYRTEMASWHGTDIFLEGLSDKRQDVGGYFSYLLGDKSICVFFSKSRKPRVIATIAFDSTYNTETAIVDGNLRDFTDFETNLWLLRQAALARYETDTLFKSYRDMNPNFIPLSDEKGKRVYVLTGTSKHGIVVFGNDYSLTFSKNNRVKDVRRLHKNIIVIPYGTENGDSIAGAMHNHSPETGNLITATDICTLMLYSGFAKWKQHVVISEKSVSIWDCEKNRLVVVDRKAFDKSNKDQKGTE